MWSNRRWLSVGLGLSLIANLFLIGIVTGRFYAHPDNRLQGRNRPLVPGVLFQKLPADERKEFGKIMRPHKAEIARLNEALNEAKTEAEVAIAAPIYDRAAVLEAFAKVRRAYEADQAALHGGYADALAVLTPASRAALVPRQDGRP